MKDSSFNDHLILNSFSIKNALEKLNKLGPDAILFVINEEKKLLGSLTDGDLRRGYINGLSMDSQLELFLQKNPRKIDISNFTVEEIINFRKLGLKVIPVINEQNIVVNVINFRHLKSYLPVDAVIMAGGRGQRLKPLTNEIPKPLLKVGDIPIIERNVNRLLQFGIENIWISVRYLGHKIKSHFEDLSLHSCEIQYVEEKEPLGTIGAVRLIQNFKNDFVLVTNSDLLTNIDYEKFFSFFIDQDADMAVASIPYTVKIPYAVLETENSVVKHFKEKPNYTYYSNAGIYLIRRAVLKSIPENLFYNSTDLMNQIISKGGKVVAFPMIDYWLDIGQHEDYLKAQEDVKHIQF